MTDIQNSLFETMKIFADQNKQEFLAQIIECEITREVNASTGEYEGKFQGQIIRKLFATVPYRPGDLVYIIVPNGDFTKNKFILNKVNPTTYGNAFEETVDIDFDKEW